MLFGFRKPAPRPAPSLPAERLHTVGGRSLPLRVVENARAKRLTLRIDPGGQSLRLTTPPGLAMREIDRFLDRHRDWLETRLKKMPDRPTLKPGAKIPVRGVPHRILHETGRRGTVTVGREDGEPILTVHGDRTRLARRLSDFLKRQAKAEIEPLVEKHCAAVGKRAKAIRYKDTTSRWGSCSAAGNLAFSWRIMMAPPMVIDYLVAHEVAHLKEMNHGPKFWALCKKLCPETERCRAWLKRNGAALQAIDFGGE